MTFPLERTSQESSLVIKSRPLDEMLEHIAKYNGKFLGPCFVEKADFGNEIITDLTGMMPHSSGLRSYLPTIIFGKPRKIMSAKISNNVIGKEPIVQVIAYNDVASNIAHAYYDNFKNALNESSQELSQYFAVYYSTLNERVNEELKYRASTVEFHKPELNFKSVKTREESTRNQREPSFISSYDILSNDKKAGFVDVRFYDQDKVEVGTFERKRRNPERTEVNIEDENLAIEVFLAMMSAAHKHNTDGIISRFNKYPDKRERPSFTVLNRSSEPLNYRTSQN